MKNWLISKMKFGRQESGYKVLTLWSKWFFDFHIIYISKDTHVPYHTDKIEGKKHRRINLELGAKNRTSVSDDGDLFVQNRLYLFRPDKHHHKVDTAKTDTWIISFGF